MNKLQTILNGTNNSITELFEWDSTEKVATRPMFMQYRVPGQTYALFYTHDGNKNVSEVVHFSRANGVAAHYEYAPFGEVTAQVRQGGITAYDFAALNPWRFSSEYADDASATVYYNYRHYEPMMGRWMSRDPIEDCAFSELRRPSVVKRRMRENILNVYLFVDNFFGRTDKLGLEKCVCGPDVTKWLVEQMNTNAQHPVIKTMREIELPRYIPFLNIGWVLGELIDFRNLVKAGAVWDFKASQSFTSQNCPKGEKCAHTVGLCGECVDYDVPGNIHYGYIGRAASLRAWFLHNRASAAQAEGIDPDEDVAAIDMGIELFDGSNKDFCAVFKKYKNRLNYGSNERAKQCCSCKEQYQ